MLHGYPMALGLLGPIWGPTPLPNFRLALVIHLTCPATGPWLPPAGTRPLAAAAAAQSEPISTATDPFGTAGKGAGRTSSFLTHYLHNSHLSGCLLHRKGSPTLISLSWTLKMSFRQADEGTPAVSRAPQDQITALWNGLHSHFKGRWLQEYLI